MKKTTLICPLCGEKIEVVIEPLQKEIVCSMYNKKFKVVKLPNVIVFDAISSNPSFYYTLEPIDE